MWSSLVWSIKSDNEIDQFDHEEEPNVFWGTDAQAIISEGREKLYFPKMGCAIKAFRLQIPEMKQLSKKDK